MSQWSFYFRLSKQDPLGRRPAHGESRQFAANAASLVGSVEGVVMLKTLAAASNAPGIPVSLDGGQTNSPGPMATTTSRTYRRGRTKWPWLWRNCPRISTPASPEFPRAGSAAAPTRADFEVLPLMTIQGKVRGPDQAPLEDIVIRLTPGTRYTTTNKQEFSRCTTSARAILNWRSTPKPCRKAAP